MFLERPCLVWKTCARRNRLVAKLHPYFVSSPLNNEGELQLIPTRFLAGGSTASRLLMFRTQQVCLRRQVPSKRRVKTYKGCNRVKDIT